MCFAHLASKGPEAVKQYKINKRECTPDGSIIFIGMEFMGDGLWQCAIIRSVGELDGVCCMG